MAGTEALVNKKNGYSDLKNKCLRGNVCVCVCVSVHKHERERMERFLLWQLQRGFWRKST